MDIQKKADAARTAVYGGSPTLQLCVILWLTIAAEYDTRIISMLTVQPENTDLWLTMEAWLTARQGPDFGGVRPMYPSYYVWTHGNKLSAAADNSLLSSSLRTANIRF